MYRSGLCEYFGLSAPVWLHSWWQNYFNVPFWMQYAPTTFPDRLAHPAFSDVLSSYAEEEKYMFKRGKDRVVWFSQSEHTCRCGGEDNRLALLLKRTSAGAILRQGV